MPTPHRSPHRTDDGESLFLSTFRREPLVGLLAEQGIHADDVVALTRWAPLALTDVCWRNSVVEDWHADPDSSLTDGAMMMANVATTRVFAWAVRDLCGAWEIDPWACLDDVAEIEPESLAAYLFEAVEEVTDPQRVLPHGATLTTIGGTGVAGVREHAEIQVEGFAQAAERYGSDVVLLWLAARASRVCTNWWGGTGWPVHVDRWLDLLDNPDHDRWAGRHPGRPPHPATDRDWFRYTLLTAPDQLPVAVADWAIDPGLIGYVPVEWPTHAQVTETD